MSAYKIIKSPNSWVK